MRRLFLAVAVSWSALAAAAVPLKIPYQGRLTATDGTPINGAQTFTFALFLTPSGGTAIWSETHTVNLTEGLYSVLLGDFSACDAGLCAGIPATVFTGAELHLEVAVGGVALTPRQRVASVPYSVRAQELSGGAVDATSVRAASLIATSATAGTLSVQQNALVGGNVAAGSLSTAMGAPVIDSTGKYVGPAIVSGGSGITVSSTGSIAVAACTTGQTLRHNGAGWTCATLPTLDSLVYSCPKRADTGCSNAHTCYGQLSLSSTCIQVGGSAINCTSTTVTCSQVGRIVGP